jgi:hypothetical protein
VAGCAPTLRFSQDLANLCIKTEGTHIKQMALTYDTCGCQFLESIALVRSLSTDFFVLSNLWINGSIYQLEVTGTATMTHGCTTVTCRTSCSDWKTWSANSSSTCGWTSPMLTLTGVFLHCKIILPNYASFRLCQSTHDVLHLNQHRRVTLLYKPSSYLLALTFGMSHLLASYNISPKLIPQ